MICCFCLEEMGKKRYQTNEERKAARRESARRSYHKRKSEKTIDDEFERLMRINPNIYPAKKRYSDSEKQFIQSLLNMPLDTKLETKRTTRHNESIAKQQLGLASSKISNKKRKAIKCIDFDISLMKSEHERQYFFEGLPDVIRKLLDTINFNTEHWIVYYNYDKGGWRTKTLDSITERYLRDQIKHDLEEHLHDYIEYDKDYDFFPVMIQQLKLLRFINIDEMEPPHGIGRKKHEGKFWRWLLKDFPEIDLERFMIFHRLDKHAASLIQRDTCFVYACQMVGLNNDLINDMRYSIQKRSLTHQDIRKLATNEKLDLRIHIKEPDKSYYINPNGKNEVRLVLMNNHYMIDEKVNVSPYYILHRKEIMNDRITRYWKREDKMKIVKKVNGYYVKDSIGKFSLRKVINALFQVNAFEPITMNDYMSYASLVCFENISPINSLEYDSQFCCRLKCEPKTSIQELEAKLDKVLELIE